MPSIIAKANEYVYLTGLGAAVLQIGLDKNTS